MNISNVCCNDPSCIYCEGTGYVIGQRHERHCPVPRAASRGEGAVCMCVGETFIVRSYDAMINGRGIGEPTVRECYKVDGTYVHLLNSGFRLPEDDPCIESVRKVGRS